MIVIESLRKEFSVPGGTEVAVRGLDLSIEDEEFVTLVGPSGCGKTTTLRCIAGLETPTDGTVLIDGSDVTDVPAHKRGLAMMFQNIALYPHMKIRDNIAYPLKIRGIAKDARYEEARKAADLLQISDMLDKYPGELSGGQRQRSALARTIVQQPRAFLMDEPLSDLDAKLKVEIRKEIQRVHKRVQKPTLYVTHDQEEAMTMSDRIAVMNDGRIEQIGSPDDLYQSPHNLFVAQFIGNPTINIVEGTLTSVTNGTATFEVGDVQFSLSVGELETEPSASDVLVGVRPESVDVSRDNTPNSFEGTLEIVERIGDRLLATIESDGLEIRSTVPADHQLVEDERVYYSFEEDAVHVFDRDTERVLFRGPGV